MRCVFSKRGQTVSVILDRDSAGNSYRLTVTDEGPGVSVHCGNRCSSLLSRAATVRAMALAWRSPNGPSLPMAALSLPITGRAAACASSFASPPPRLKTRQFWRRHEGADVQRIIGQPSGPVRVWVRDAQPDGAGSSCGCAGGVHRARGGQGGANLARDQLVGELQGRRTAGAGRDGAEEENLDIAVANARILEAEATDETAFAGLLPTVSGSAGSAATAPTAPFPTPPPTASRPACRGLMGSICSASIRTG